MCGIIIVYSVNRNVGALVQVPVESCLFVVDRKNIANLNTALLGVITHWHGEINHILNKSIEVNMKHNLSYLQIVTF